MTPDPRLAALRALAEKATGSLSGRLSAYDPNAVEDYRAATSPDAILEILDALAAAERDRDNARFELQGMDHMRQKDNGYLIAQRDALAARLAGAERVVEAARRAIHPQLEDKPEDLAGGVADALANYDEAGGEGRGT